MALLEVRGVAKTFGALRALDGVDVSVAENTFHGLIGPNGSGKSTLLKAIAGAHYPDMGTITFAGRDITALRPSERSRLGLSLKFQITAVLPELSVYDNVLVVMQSDQSLWSLLRSRTRRSLHGEILEALARFRLADHANRLAGELSHGQLGMNVLQRVAEERNISTEVLRKQITVDGDADANIISIRSVAETAAGAAAVANATATSLVNWRTEQRQRQVRARVEFLRQQLATLAGKTAPSEVAAAADLRTQLAQAQAELNVPSPELTVVSPAQTPTDPFTPKPLRDGVIGLLAGLVLGVFLAAVRDRLDRRLRSVEHIEQAYPYPLLGIVPHVPGSDLKSKVIDADPHSVLADAYRTIRTNLMLVTLKNESESPRGDVWVISSAVSGEGKSAAVANLARALAASGLDVLAISGDLHKPVLHRYFGVAVDR